MRLEIDELSNRAEMRASSYIQPPVLLLTSPKETIFEQSCRGAEFTSELKNQVTKSLQDSANLRLTNNRFSIYATYVKRLLDFLAASILLPFSLPLILLTLLIIKLETAGSPIYRQKRVGLHGRIFTLYKLRTMYKDSDQLRHKTAPNDERVTWVGAFLREKKIDELPQLINVILGDMSLIGPRPLSLDETNHLCNNEGFSINTPGLCPSVRPGLTGLEQCTRSSLEPYSYRFQLNSQYVDNISFKIDMLIVKKTLFVCPLVCALTVLSTLSLLKLLLMLI